MAELDQYSSAAQLLGQKPKYVVDPTEQNRLATYALYEAMYWCVPDTFKLLARGQSDTNPIYIPAGRTIVETIHRFTANAVQFQPDPQFGTPNDILLAQQVMTDLARRERLYSKFNTNKRYGIMRGDWLFYIYADPERDPGSKVSVQMADPSKCFKITNPLNDEEVIGWHIIDLQKDDQGNDIIRRRTWRKETGKGGPSPIVFHDATYEIDAWGGPGMSEDDVKVVEELVAEYTLPSPIDDLPIYHIPNFDEPNGMWGSSEMRGIERIFAAVNQSVSDEELSLALDGLGVYATDSGTPIDDNGNDVPWNMGPGRVVELPDGKKMYRISGTTSVEPYQGHLSYLHSQLDQVMAMSAVAKGNVDVTTAESGVALLLQLGPLLSRAVEKEQIVTDVSTNMLYNLSKWYVAYEGTAFNSLFEVTRWIPVYGEKLPKNAKQEFDELLKLAGLPSPIVSNKYIRQRLRTIGYDDMPDDTTMQADIIAEKQALGTVEADTFGSRVDSEVNAQLTAGDNTDNADSGGASEGA